jgi:sugar lactone lactonase YvrE
MCLLPNGNVCTAYNNGPPEITIYSQFSGRVVDKWIPTPMFKIGGMCCTADGLLAMTNYSGKPYSVYIYTTAGELLRQFGANVLDMPTGIALDRDNTLVVCSNGGLLRFSDAGDHMGRIDFWAHVAAVSVNPTNGNYYVVATNAGHVIVRNHNGGLVSDFKTSGDGRVDSGPRGICFDNQGVAFMNAVLGGQGRLSAVTVDKKHINRCFMAMRDARVIAVDSAGRLYVCNDQTIMVFTWPAGGTTV